jgi:uncharacterized protein YyaL (SSP411 family)
MIAGFARAARVLVERPSAGAWLEVATRAARFVKSTLWVDGRLLRRYRAGDAAIEAYAEDHAYLVWGLLELFQASGDAEWLEWAIALQAQQDEKFWDDKEGGWFSTTGTDPTVLLRLKEDYDGAEPAASSVAALNALTLSYLTGDEQVRGRAARTLARYGPRIGAAGRTIPMMLCALSGWHAGYAQLAIAGAPDRAAPLTREFARFYRPFTIVVPLAPGLAQQRLARLLPFTAAMTDHGGAAAYVCRDFTCRQPVTTPEELVGQL